MRACLLLALAASLLAADPAPKVDPAVPPASASAPVAVDKVTSRRAEEAADAFLADEQAKREPASTEALTAIGEAELRLLEARTFMDQGQPKTAAARWFDAQTALRGLPVDERRRLGDRYAKAKERMDALAQALMETDALDPGTVAKDPGEPAAPAGPPPAQTPAEAPPATPEAPANP